MYAPFPDFYPHDVTQWSKENGLLLEAYSPLGSSKQVGESLAVPEVRETPAQSCISESSLVYS